MSASSNEHKLDLRPHNTTFVPNGFGLNNTGSICHFNALLQALLSCSAFNEVVINNEDYMQGTKLGREVLAFVRSALNGCDPSDGSARILGALMSELSVRKHTKLTFGLSQESASEGLVFLLEMLEPPNWDKPHVLTRLFQHRFEATVMCGNCEHHDTKEDLACHFELFGMDPNTVSTPVSFSNFLRCSLVDLPDYCCDSCGAKNTSTRRYRLAMIPEILVCLLNVYSNKREWYFPQELEFRGSKKDKLLFKPVAQVLHSGVLSGGHYIARACRTNSVVWDLNDSNARATDSIISPVSGTYMVFYTFVE